jgi:hypothetical protein
MLQQAASNLADWGYFCHSSDMTLCFLTTHLSRSLIVRSDLGVPTFSTQRLYASHHVRVPSKVELWARNVREFYINADLHVTFRDLLHAVKLQHGTFGFTSLRRKACCGFYLPKNPTSSAGCKRTNLGTKRQHGTSRPPKLLMQL